MPKTYKNKRTALYVLLTYVIAQLSGFLFIIPIVSFFRNQGLDNTAASFAAAGWWTFISFAAGLAVCAVLIARDKRFFAIWKGKPSGIFASIGWGIIGFFMLLIGQSVAGMIEMAIGIDPGSENTANIATVAQAAPVMIISVVLLGPIFEELVFRRVVFGSLNQTMNFWLATAISSLVFAAIHLEFIHLLIYFTTGLILAFLYQKTKRLITPIIAHVGLNSYVMLIQLNMDKIQTFLEQLEQMQ